MDFIEKLVVVGLVGIGFFFLGSVLPDILGIVSSTIGVFLMSFVFFRLWFDFKYGGKEVKDWQK